MEAAAKAVKLKNMQGAWKVGLLVVVFVGLLVGAYQFLGRSLLAAKTTPLYAEVPDATGVNIGAPVLMAGVKVGQVEKIELSNPKLAKLTFAMNEDARIPDGSIVQVPTPLLGIGDNPVMIMPPAKVSGSYVATGATLSGTKLGAFEGILPDLSTTITELNQTLVAARQFIADPTLKDSIAKLSDSGAATLDRFGKLANQASSLIADNRESIAASMKSVQMAMVDVQKSALIARQMIEDPAWKDQAQTLFTSINGTVEKATEVLGSVDALINDPNIRQPIHETLENAKTMTESGTRIAASAEKITENGVTISKNVADLTEKANVLAEEARTVLQKLQDFFNKVPTGGGIKGLEAGMDLVRESKPGYWRTDVSARLPIRDGSLHFGVYDAFEGNKLTAQLGRSFGKDNEYRYGIFASKPGVGVDFKLARGLKFKGDLYDINDPSLDLGLRYEFKNGLLGWLGFNRVLDNNALFAGLGFRK